MFEWTLMKRLIWIKAAVISGAASLYETVTGAIVSFVALHAKALKKLVVNIEPVQDLHGYDAPWPPGGGVNKLDTSKTYQQGDNQLVLGQEAAYSNRTLYLAAGTYTVTVETTKTPTIYVATDQDTGGTGIGTTAASRSFTLAEASHVSVWLYIGTGITAADVTNFQLEAGSTFSGFKPYSNECPISGWTGADVTADGKNLFDSSVILNATGWSVENGVYTGDSQELDYRKFGYFLPGLFPTDRQVVFSFDMNCEGANRPGYFWIVYSDGTRSNIEVPKEYTGHRKLVSTAGKTITSFYFGYSNTAIFSLSNIQFEFGSDETAFEAFVGDSREISWQNEAGTVYKGKVTVKQDGSVDLTATDKKATITRATSKSWSTSLAGKGIFTVTFDDAKIDGIPAEQLLSNIFSAATARGGAGDVDYQMTTYSSIADDKWIRFIGPWPDLAAANDWIDTVTLDVLYPLAEPVTYHLDSITQLSTIVGQNNIWADAGDVEVTYYAK